MRNRLQYLYSISVLVGVLITAFFMMDQNGNTYVRMQATQESSYRSEASAGDSALSGLFAIESELVDRAGSQIRRMPSDAKRPKSFRLFKKRLRQNDHPEKNQY